MRVFATILFTWLVTSLPGFAQEKAAVEYKTAFDNLAKAIREKDDFEQNLQNEKSSLENLLAERQNQIDIETLPLQRKYNEELSKKLLLIVIPDEPKELNDVNNELTKLKANLAFVRRQISVSEKNQSNLVTSIGAKRATAEKFSKKITENQEEISRLEGLRDIINSPGGLESQDIITMWKNILLSYELNNFGVLMELFKSDLLKALDQKNIIPSSYGDYKQVPQGISYIVWDKVKNEPFRLKNFLRGEFFRLPSFKELSVSISHDDYSELGSTFLLDQFPENISWNLENTDNYTECIKRSLIDNSFSNTDWLHAICRELNPFEARLDLERAVEKYGFRDDTSLLSASAAKAVSDLFIAFEKDLRALTNNILPDKFKPVILSSLEEMLSKCKNQLDEALTNRSHILKVLNDKENELEALTVELVDLAEKRVTQEKKLTELEAKLFTLTLDYKVLVNEVEKKNEQLKRQKADGVATAKKIIIEKQNAIAKKFETPISETNARINALENLIAESNDRQESLEKIKQEKLKGYLNFLEADFINKNLKITAKFEYNQLCLVTTTPKDIFLTASPVKNIYFKNDVLPEDILNDTFLGGKEGFSRLSFTNKFKEEVFGLNGTNKNCVFVRTIRGEIARWWDKKGGLVYQSKYWDFELEAKISRDELIIDYEHSGSLIENIDIGFYDKVQVPVNLEEFFEKEIRDVEQGESSFLTLEDLNETKVIASINNNEGVPKTNDADQKTSAPLEPVKSIRLLELTSIEDVKKIQSMLKVLGLYDLTIDGVWGSGSQKSINLFRQKNNIPLSSEWDQKTQDALTQLSGSKIE